METVIPYSKTVRESQKAGLSLEEYLNFRGVPNTKNSRKIALAYEALTAEILERSAGK
jgi:cellulose biosynthesis protein BcsQ